MDYNKTVGKKLYLQLMIKKNKLKNLIIFNFDSNYNLKEKIFSKSANIEEKKWILKDVMILKINDGISKKEKLDYITINSIYDYEKLQAYLKILILYLF